MKDIYLRLLLEITGKNRRENGVSQVFYHLLFSFLLDIKIAYIRAYVIKKRIEPRLELLYVIVRHINYKDLLREGFGGLV